MLNTGIGFLYPTETTTLTIPSTAAKVITVGAYDARYNQPANFSGRGFTRVANLVKPDMVAPGVEIVSCSPGGVALPTVEPRWRRLSSAAARRL